LLDTAPHIVDDGSSQLLDHAVMRADKADEKRQCAVLKQLQHDTAQVRREHSANALQGGGAREGGRDRPTCAHTNGSSDSTNSARSVLFSASMLADRRKATMFAAAPNMYILSEQNF
jgi:hypothetical protein